MKINKLSNINFKAHFKDNNDYRNFKHHIINEHGYSPTIITDLEKKLSMYDPAEIEITCYDCNEYRSYLFGKIKPPSGDEISLHVEQMNCITIPDAILDALGLLLRK